MVTASVVIETVVVVATLVAVVVAASASDHHDNENSDRLLVEFGKQELDAGGDGGLVNDEKRRWGHGNNLALWGKRRQPFVDDADSNHDGLLKRKWGQSNMALWGKRASRLLLDDDVDWDTAYPIEKRKWGQKNMALWGRKRK